MKENAVSRIVNSVARVLRWATGISFLLLFCITILSITLRYVAGVAWLWVPDFSRLLFIWIVFTGAAVMYADNGHLVMDFFVNRMRPDRRDRLELVIHAAMIAFLLVLVVKGIDIARVRMRIPFDTWNLPTGYAYLALPVNAAFMVTVDIEYIVRRIRTGEGRDNE
ncbi:TRAP transporter small permease [Salinispira pacifica]